MLRPFLYGCVLSGLVMVHPSYAPAQGAALRGGAANVVTPRLQFTAEEMAFANAVARYPSLAGFYGRNGLQMVFTGQEGQALREALRQAIRLMPDHGIPAERYSLARTEGVDPRFRQELVHAIVLARLIEDMKSGVVRPQDVAPQIHRGDYQPDTVRLMREFVESPDPRRFISGLAPQVPAYKALREALKENRKFVVAADLPKVPVAVWRAGMIGEAVIPLRQRLGNIGFAAESADPRKYDEALAAAVAKFQEAVGLQADGVAGPDTIRRLNSDGDDWRSRAILVALERLRWMGGEDMQSRHVMVNIPEFTTRIIENGQVVFQTRSVVGKGDADMQTPEFSDQMEYVVVNPRWNVPRSITVREYLPKLQANPHAVGYLEVVDGNGNVIPRGNVDFSRYTAENFPYRMRQPPSNDNALGLVKFIFPNRWNIYLHDTPSKYLFKRQSRAYSHGCVRIGDPFDLAYQLLSQQTENPRAMFQRALDSGKETYLHLEPNIPVHLVYFTAYPDETGQIRYSKDVYGRDAAVWKLLGKAGLDLDT